MTQAAEVKLSQLPEDTQLSYEGAACTYSVRHVREMIGGDGDWALQEWKVCTPKTWNPDAEYMIENYIDHESSNELPEDLSIDIARNVMKEGLAKIQAVLDEMLGEHQYWMFEGPEVIIDSL
ncbi:hypothetical protein QP794_01770 [Paenibacillus sp. UMB7766-LJ446]|uniref:hypothetical protein n=1 Tax=Paenibacillus sp. UMB7766-LJ446 TaxID=3046313 RepID=UPI00254DB96D|nr:hypothetical protein [Paenibacillus sp. UMB7766-LJ446]MDK8188810.1 hypothetical protein [Paenibacillus sp. UMB7766-LJ446]